MGVCKETSPKHNKEKKDIKTEELNSIYLCLIGNVHF